MLDETVAKLKELSPALLQVACLAQKLKMIILTSKSRINTFVNAFGISSASLSLSHVSIANVNEKHIINATETFMSIHSK